MKNCNDLVKMLTNDINELQNKIENRNLYNIRSFVIRQLIKSGIAIDYAFPFILTAIIIANLQTAKGNSPFRVDEITERASIENIDTSSDIHIQYISYDFSYENEGIEYSTGWIVNDKGLYERTVTSYRISNEIDLSNTEKILSMTKEEIDKSLVITNIKTIKKDILTEEDKIYNQEAIIVINHSESTEETYIRKETKNEVKLNLLYYILLVFVGGNIWKNFEKLFSITYIRDKLRETVPIYRTITKEELETMRKILKLKQENLAMINNSPNNFNKTDGHFSKLRKK